MALENLPEAPPDGSNEIVTACNEYVTEFRAKLLALRQLTLGYIQAVFVPGPPSYFDTANWILHLFFLFAVLQKVADGNKKVNEMEAIGRRLEQGVVNLEMAQMVENLSVQITGILNETRVCTQAHNNLMGIYQNRG